MKTNEEALAQAAQKAGVTVHRMLVAYREQQQREARDAPENGDETAAEPAA